MKIPISFIVVFLTAWLTIEAWMASSIVELKTTVAVLVARK